MKRLHYLYSIPLIYAIAGAAFAFVDHSWAMARPVPNFQNLPAYITALERSRDPQMMAFKRLIAAGPANLAHEERLAKADGIPVTLAQVQPPMLSKRDNAAPLFIELYQIRNQKPLGMPLYALPMGGYGYAYTPQQIAFVQHIVSSRPDVFGLLDQAAEKPYCVFPNHAFSPPSAGANSLHPIDMYVFDDVKLLNTQSYLLASQRHYASAVKTESLGFNIARGAASVPASLIWMNGCDAEQYTLGGMQSILYQAQSNAAIDEEVERTILADNPNLSLRKKFSINLVQTLHYMNSMKAAYSGIAPISTSLNDLPRTNESQSHVIRNLFDAAAAYNISVMIPLIQMADHPGPARRALFTRLSLPLSPTFGAQPPTSLNPVIALYQHENFTYYNFWINSDDECRGDEQVTLAAADVLAAEARTGKLPSALPKRFMDPFSRKPLGYRTNSKGGFVIYSVGLNPSLRPRISRQGHQFSEYSAVFRYPPPPPMPVPADELTTIGKRGRS